LDDKTCTEYDDVEFTCEVNKPDKTVTWYRDDVQLKPSDKYQITEENVTHTLKINNVPLEESGEISACVGDDRTSAKLTVKGSYVCICIRSHSLSIILFYSFYFLIDMHVLVKFLVLIKVIRFFL